MGQHFPIAKGYTGDQFPGHEARSRAGFQEQDIQGCGLGTWARFMLRNSFQR